MKVYTDAAKGSGVCGFAWKIILDDGTEMTGSRYVTNEHTSMEAEYYALLDGLRHANRESEGAVSVYCDCRPMIDKMRVPDGTNECWYQRRRGAHRLLNKFDSWELNWTPRDNNEDADRLAYEALERGRRSMS
jgi:Ribonuclease HI